MNELSKKIGEESISQHADAAVPTSISSASSSVRSVSRRRLVQAGLAATPVVLALSGRSAMAGNSGGSSTSTTATCLSHAAWYSANPKGKTVSTSRTPRSNGSPGYSPLKWKPNETTLTFPGVPQWPSDCVPFATLKKVSGAKVTTVSYVRSSLKTYQDFTYMVPGFFGSVDAGWGTGTKLSWLDNSRSCSQILIQDAGKDNLVAHVCAAYLNAKLAEEGLAQKFPISSADVKLCYTNQTLGGNKVTDTDLLAFFKQTCV